LKPHQIGAQCGTRERLLGLHFFMPAHWVPAIEVIRSGVSDEAVAQAVSDIMRSVRKKPVQVKRDVPGFLANRIQHALMREAIALIDEGFASAEDVDLAVRYGFGFRYIAAGPLMQNLVNNGDFGVKSASRKGFYQWDEDEDDPARLDPA
jgi:3-hydroxybutyryl-CoA dehydrogenase